MPAKVKSQAGKLMKSCSFSGLKPGLFAYRRMCIYTDRIVVLLLLLKAVRKFTFVQNSKKKTMLDVLLKQTDENSETKGIFKVSDRADKPIKSFMKSVSWRIVGTLDTIMISYFITGRVTVALSIGSVEVLTKTVLYYFHERLWF